MNYFNSYLDKIRTNKYVKALMNFYIIISLIFIIWMLFIDTNSYIFHSKLNSEIEELKIKKETLQREIIKDQKFIDDMKDLDKYEAFAREKFFMKKDSEEIFILEFKDSIKN